MSEKGGKGKREDEIKETWKQNNKKRMLLHECGARNIWCDFQKVLRPFECVCV